MPIKISHCSLGFITRADTMYVETDENGDTVVARAKTREELPYLNVKWFKTYTSMDAAVKSLTEEKQLGGRCDRKSSKRCFEYGFI